MKTVIHILLVLTAAIHFVQSAGQGKRTWSYFPNMSYPSPAQWPSLPDTMCKGVRQSPIDVVISAVEYFSDLQAITITGNPQAEAVLTNTGISVMMEVNAQWNISFGTSGKLKPNHIHWHWGSTSTQGSEHTIEGYKFPMEGHLVCFNNDLYPDIQAAAGSPSGLYVIGVMYRLSSTDNKMLNPITSALSKIPMYNNKTTITEVAITDLLPKSLSKYFRYEGSLTTPPCTENVIWTLIKEPIPISEHQLQAFRGLHFNSPDSARSMGDNYRPPVASETRSDYVRRTVYASFPTNEASLRSHFLVSFQALFLLIPLMSLFLLH